MGFSETDILQIEDKGLTTKEVEHQLDIFRRGNIKVDIVKAATANDGIFTYSESEKKEFIKFFEHHKQDLKLIKFVPASGAATRMFKSLHNFVSEYNPDQGGLRNYLDQSDDEVLQRFFEGVDQLPFHDEAVKLQKKNIPTSRRKLMAKSNLY